MRYDSVNNCFSEYGTMCHSILQKYSEGKLEVYELLDEFKKRFPEEVIEPFPNMKYCNLKERYYDDGVSFFANFDGLGNYKVLSVEERFKENIQDKFYFTGFIDLVLMDENGDIIIVDWKSKSGFKDDAEEKKYRRQLYLYCYYIKQKYGKFPTKLKFNLFRKQDEKIYDFNIDDYNESIKWMFDTVSEIERLIYCKYDTFYCSNLCGFRYICALKEQIEKDDDLKKYILDKKKKPPKQNSKNSKTGG